MGALTSDNAGAVGAIARVTCSRVRTPVLGAAGGGAAFCWQRGSVLPAGAQHVLVPCHSGSGKVVDAGRCAFLLADTVSSMLLVRRSKLDVSVRLGARHRPGLPVAGGRS